MHLFEIYIFHTMEAPAFPLTTTALPGIAGNIYFHPSPLVLTAFEGQRMARIKGMSTQMGSGNH